MKITKTTLLFIATLFFLATPLMFTAGNASAAQFVHNDGATLNANGGWDLPEGVCYYTLTTSTDTNSDGIPNAEYITPTPATPADCATAIAAVVGTPYDASGIADATTCANNGGLWSNYRHSCAMSGWDTINPDTGVRYGLDTTTFSGNQGCLRCHNSAYMINHSPDGSAQIAAKERYLLTGHRNMLRKVVTEYDKHLNDGTTLPAGTTLPLGNVDWTSSNSTVPGFASVSGAAPYTLPAGTEYIWGGWWQNLKRGQLLREIPATDSPRTVAAGGSYTCSECHTTGWDMPGASTPTQNVEPPVALNIGTNGDTWTYEGVQCSRCHDHSADSSETALTDYDSSHNNGVLYENQESIQLCYQCHTQEGDPNASQSQVAVGGHSGYANAFAGHFRTNQFLNSPHARFTGTFGQLADGSAYDTHFRAGSCTDEFYTNSTDCTNAGETWTSATNGSNGCVACHDVHVSSVDPDVMDPTSSMSNIKAGGTCGTSCHSYIQLATGKINHPIAANTPLDGDLSTPKGKMMACVTCHMGASSSGIASHIFRIEPDESYNTIPTEAQFNAGQTTANTIADPDHNNYPSVYMDVDLVCGQCHGGGTDEANPAYTKKDQAPYYSKAQLSTLAENMHNTYPTAKFTSSADSSISYTVNFNANTSVCPTSVTCTYTWDFGDGSSTETGLTVNHTYADGTPQTVTLTISTNAHTSSTATQTVTPTAVHQAPTCNGILDMTSANVNQVVTLTDASSADSTAGVYVNWGDGSGMSNAALGGSVSHSYIWPGNYTVTSIVQDDMGFNCTYKNYIKVAAAGVNPGSGDLVITTDASVPTSYYVKGLNNFGDLVTKASGSFDTGSATVSLGAGDYQVYLYYGYGHSCTFTQGQAATVTDGGSTTVSATSCN